MTNDNHSPRLETAIQRFDAANAEDPNIEQFAGIEQPKELLYAQRMTAWLEKIAPNASELMQLAVRCQHIRRWEIPRSDYPMGKVGYKAWRKQLQRFHGETAGEILREVGYDEETIMRLQTILRKEKLKHDPDVQLLEDVICLVFLENYFADFAKQHDEEKLIGIVRKTWAKMSERGHAAALEMELSAEVKEIVGKALGNDG